MHVKINNLQNRKLKKNQYQDESPLKGDTLSIGSKDHTLSDMSDFSVK